MGIALIMLSGGIDLSVGYQMSLIGVVLGILMTKTELPLALVMLIAIALGCAMSMLNGILYIKLGVFPFVITLATQYVFYGISYTISGSQTYTGFSDAFKVIGQGSIGPIPIPIIIMAVIVIIGSIILNRTYFGRYIYALGSNAEAVKLAGVKGSRIRLSVYALAGLFTALGTIVYISRTGSASSTMGPGTEFTLISAALLGGIKMGGGGGKMSSMVVGVLILTVIQNGMQMMQMDTYQQYIVKGLVLVIAIGIDTAQSKRVIRQGKIVQGTPPSDVDTPELRSEES
ncbi:MAG: ABC transporter permease [Oscillospiraceae bacterium]|nr:ABC transporter permease [Oscillospiraceae bacterium]